MSQLSISLDDLKTRVQARLRSGAPPMLSTVIWAEGEEEVAVAVSSAAVKVSNGWLVAEVPLTAKLTTGATLSDSVQVVFFLGRAGQAAGLRASATVATGSDPDLADRWGQAVITAVWDGLLDSIDAALLKQQLTRPGARLRGFQGGDSAILVEIDS